MIAPKAIHTPKKGVRVLQRRLYSSAKADPMRRYGNLYDKVCRADVLREAWRRVSGKKGCAGVDGVSIGWIRARPRGIPPPARKRRRRSPPGNRGLAHLQSSEQLAQGRNGGWRGNRL